MSTEQDPRLLSSREFLRELGKGAGAEKEISALSLRWTILSGIPQIKAAFTYNKWACLVCISLSLVISCFDLFLKSSMHLALLPNSVHDFGYYSYMLLYVHPDWHPLVLSVILHLALPQRKYILKAVLVQDHTSGSVTSSNLSGL